MNWTPYLIVCPMVFLASLVDAIGGGGGLISLPAYLFAGLPIHQAIATNKVSSTIGTTIATWRYCKNTTVNLMFILPAVGLAMVGSALGAKLNLLVPDTILKGILLFVLPVVAFYVLRKKTFDDSRKENIPEKKARRITLIASFIIGCYDGFYGPGTGTFLMIVFIGMAKMDVMHAACYTKIINWTSNISALAIYLFTGRANLTLGLAAAVFSIMGGYVGSGMVLKNGMKVVKPVVLVVIVLLILKILSEM